jgi:two-component system LytT family response regulator
MKVKSLIIEDSPMMASILKDLLEERHPEIEILGIARNGKDGLDMVEQLQPELVFLDIEMPDMSGFEMLYRVENIRFKTIFTTAHSHYAIKAFRFNALDYLVKPIDEKELSQSIRRFLADTKSYENPLQIQQALQNLNTENIEDQKLILSTQEGPLQIALKKIVKIQGDRNYSNIYLSDRSKELSSKSLGYFEDVLEDKGFFRCHRSFLINRSHVESIKSDSFKMIDQTEIPISRRKKSEAKRWFADNIQTS